MAEPCKGPGKGRRGVLPPMCKLLLNWTKKFGSVPPKFQNGFYFLGSCFTERTVKGCVFVTALSRPHICPLAFISVWLSD